MFLKAIPQSEFSEAELLILKEKMNDPVIQKYLIFLQQNAIRSLVSGSIPGAEQENQKFLIAQAHVAGTISALETLLSI